MGVTSKFRPGVHSPIMRQSRNTPTGAVSTGISATCTANNTNFDANAGRYIYYLLSAATFLKWDTWTDTYIELTPPPIAPLTWSSLEFADNRGFEGRVLSATSTTLTIPAYSGQSLLGYDVEIVSGTGAGQKRFITNVAEPVVALTGVVTAVNNVQGTTNATDTLQAMSINQYAGYQFRVAFGAGVGQVRRVIYNTATEFFLGDSTKSADDYNCNPAIFAPAIGAVAGSQTVYSIESSVVTLNAAWGTTPDSTSRFRVLSGGLFLMSSAASAPFFTMQYYDVLADTWYVRSANTLMLNVVGGDGSAENSPEVKSIWAHNLANGTQSTTVLQDLAFSYGSVPDIAPGTFLPSFVTNWAINQWAGYPLFIVSGTGAGQLRIIASNTSNALTVSSAFGTAPDSTSEYMILGYSGGTSTGTSSSTTLSDTTQAWPTNAYANYAVRILAGTGIGQVRPIASNSGTVLTVLIPWSTTPDTTSVYVIIADPDKMFTHTSNNTCIPIYNIDDDFTTLGRLNESGTAGVMAVYAGSQAEGPRWRGALKPQSIATITFVTTTATVTTVNNHNLQVGQSVTIAGATGADAAKYNGAFTITAVASGTTFTYTMGSTPAANAIGSTALSTTTITDPTKNWTTNQWAGFLVTYNTGAQTAASGAIATVTALIASNTATTLTFAANTIPVAGTSRYIIHPKRVVGVATAATDSGVATSGSTTTIVDTTQTWPVNIYAGRRVKFTGGAGQGQEVAITSNTATTLTFAIQGTAAAANTTYAIMQQGVRGVGADLQWADNGTNSQVPNARYAYLARGGAVMGFDRLDMTTDNFTLLSVSPQATTLTTGTQFAYDGKNRLYFTKIDTVEQRIYYLDLTTYQIHGGAITPFALPSALASNRMEIIHTKDGIPYLFIQQGGLAYSFRSLLFW